MISDIKQAKVFAIPDMHLKWVNRFQLAKIYKAVKDEKPDVIIQLGDLYEFYAFSKYTKDLNFISPKAEIRKSQELAYAFWEQLNKISKTSIKIQLMGNHDMRLQKRILERFPEISTILDLREEFYDFKDVIVKQSDRDYVEIDNVIYCHGWHTKRWAHVNHFGKSVVHGHTHRAALHVKQDESNEHKRLFELDCGHIINKSALPFRYTPSIYNKWSSAYGIIDKQKPRLEIL